MTHYLKIEDKNALEWLRKLIENTINADPNTPALLNHYNDVAAWHEALENPMTEAQILGSDLVSAHVKEQIRKSAAPKPKKKAAAKKKKAKAQKVEVDPYTCQTHPNYGVKRRPTSDCDRCWELYKQFHPLDYEIKRRDFELKQARKESS